MQIAQISDFHVVGQGALYQDVIPSNEMAEAAVAQLNEMRPLLDLAIFTGDLTENGTAEEYVLARNILTDLEVPHFILPGNHDERENFRAAFHDHTYLSESGPLHFCSDDYPVRIIGLDCTVPGDHHGDLNADGLAWLEITLDADTEKPTIVATHHHLFPSGIPDLDAYDNKASLEIAAVLSKFDNVERVLFGHVHRLMMGPFGGSIAVSAPSTASQIALRLDTDAKPASVMEPPGFLLHVLDSNSGVTTHFKPIGDFGPLMDFF